MKTRGIIRHFDKEGRIVIPKEYKKMLNLKDEETMEIFVGEDNTIILKKHVQEGVKGDLISKSALLKHLWDWRLQECPVGVCDEETETYKTICECIKAVEEQPTVDEKEIIRKPMERILTRLEEMRETFDDEWLRTLSASAYQGRETIDMVKQVIKEEGGIE